MRWWNKSDNMRLEFTSVQVYSTGVQVYRCTVYSNMKHEFTSVIQAEEYLRFAPGVNILLESGRKIGVLSKKK